MNKKVVVVIPSYKPRKDFIPFVVNLLKEFLFVVVVDDGSGNSFNEIYIELENERVVVLRHNKNYGKGRALKTAFDYCLKNFDNIVGVVTADADGQHSIIDILRVAQRLMQESNKLILGVRKFGKEVPFRSMLGNSVTRIVFFIVVGIWLCDTQTGLRGIPISLLSKFLLISGDRYEYEMNMLLILKKLKIPIQEILIETIYIEDNKSSYFHPIKDSFRVYYSILSFILKK